MPLLYGICSKSSLDTEQTPTTLDSSDFSFSFWQIPISKMAKNKTQIDFPNACSLQPLQVQSPSNLSMLTNDFLTVTETRDHDKFHSLSLFPIRCRIVRVELPLYFCLSSPNIGMDTSCELDQLNEGAAVQFGWVQHLSNQYPDWFPPVSSGSWNFKSITLKYNEGHLSFFTPVHLKSHAFLVAVQSSMSVLTTKAKGQHG